DRCLHELFEEQASRTPEAVAVVFEGARLSYGELNARANRVARYLRRQGIGPDQRVAICVERSLEMMVSLLGVLKAGAAYVPLDPSYPADRLAYMLVDSAPAAVLTQSAGGGEPGFLQGLDEAVAVLRLDGESRPWEQESGDNVSREEVGVRPQHLAYVIYTSGSTGQPKGVMNGHGPVVNRLHWMQRAYALDASDVVLQKTPLSFDVSVWECFWPLFNGAKLVVARPEGHKDVDYLSDLIVREGVTTLHFVPSMLQLFIDGERTAACESLLRIVSSGEALPVELAHRTAKRFPGAEIYNLYGPTEAAIDVTAWRYDAGFASSTVPLGRPVSNTRLYVLDGMGEPVPSGVAGDLYIGGVQVARGYLKRPGLTAQQFMPDPFSGEAGARMYRTGDLARWLPDGNIEYLGRNDDQVKIRGFRVELGEIEARLSTYEGIREAAVLVREDEAGDRRLVAYYTEGETRDGSGGELDVQGLRA
ncbi:non-ribosomal peptide synthetase, partial [Burkholderia stagnalis]